VKVKSLYKVISYIAYVALKYMCPSIWEAEEGGL
jgi:hypothetical protein